MVLKNLQGNTGGIDIENRLMDMGRGEERVRCLERVTWKLTLPCGNGNGITNSQWEFGVRLSKLKQRLCINLEG